ncbi:MAG: flagellar basal body rod protein FlgB [Rhodoferax sp.]
MFARLTQGLDFQSKALVVRAERQRLIASNIANADTPGYQGRDLDFRQAMEQALGQGPALALQGARGAAPEAAHLPLHSQTGSLDKGGLAYTPVTQAAMDNNTVDMDRERASFVDNAVRYEATLRFINGQARTMLSAIQGQ